jgi:hypothetical protein
MGLISTHVRTIEVAELEARVAALEKSSPHQRKRSGTSDGKNSMLSVSRVEFSHTRTMRSMIN